MTRRKPRAIFVLVVLLAMVAGGIWLFQFVGRRGSSRIERWIGQRLQQVAGAYLKPQLLFDELDYQYPLTAVLQNLRLRVPAETPGGAAIDIVRIDRAELTFLEIPSPGAPLKISGLTLRGPVLRLVERAESATGLVGFSDFLHTDPADGSADAGETRFSDIFHIRRLRLLTGQIHYEPREADARPMHLDRIDMRLETRADQSPWYRVDGTTTRDPVFALRVGGRFNVDDGRLELADSSLSLDLGTDSVRTLTPRLQALAEEYRVRGTLRLTTRGLLPLAKPQDSQLQTELLLDSGGFDLAGLALQLDRLQVTARSADGHFHILGLTANLLGGTVNATASFPPRAEPAHVQFNVQGVDLGRLLRPAPPGSASSDAGESSTGSAWSGLSGKLQAEADVSAPAAAWNEQARGSGRLVLTDASLLRIPGVSAAQAQMRKLGEWGNGTVAAGSDQGYVEFRLDGDRARVEKLDIRTAVAAVRGTGEVFFNGRLNLQLNGGPLEKLQASLGPLGKVAGWLTDRLATYEVQGTFSEPTVRLRTGGTRPSPPNPGAPPEPGPVKPN